MSISNKLVRGAVAAAIAGGAAGTANAWDVSAYSAQSPVAVYISGSTALDGTLSNAAIQTAAGQTGVCQSGTTDIYLIASSQKMILCSATAASGLTAGTALAIFKESVVGSANGVQPLINVAKGGTSGTLFLDPTSLTDSNCSAGVTTTAVGDFGTFVTHSGCTASFVTAATVIPTGGFADVESAILQTSSGAQISTADTATYLAAPVATLDQLWAVAATKSLYYALQDAESLTSTCPTNFTLYGSVVTGSTFTGRDSPSCAPSLSKSQVSGLFTRQIATGTTLGVAAGSPDTIFMCKRDKGSGTEASFEYLMVGQRCSQTSLGVPGEGTAVWANGSGGGVRTCLQDFQSGGKTTHFYSTTTHLQVANSYAIGFINTEITAANLSSAGDAFRLLAIDGALPQLSNVQNGTYEYFSTGASYQIAGGKPGAPSGSPLTVFNAIVTLIGHPVWTADSNTNYSANPWGVTGDVAPAPLYASTHTPTLPATFTSAAANPTNMWSKNASGGINNCDIAQFDTVDVPTAVNPTENRLLGTGNLNN